MLRLWRGDQADGDQAGTVALTSSGDAAINAPSLYHCRNGLGVVEPPSAKVGQLDVAATEQFHPSEPVLPSLKAQVEARFNVNRQSNRTGRIGYFAA